MIWLLKLLPGSLLEWLLLVFVLAATFAAGMRPPGWPGAWMPGKPSCCPSWKL